MKRFISVLLAVLVCALCINAAAAEVGDKISEAVYSDLAVYINHYAIPAYVIDDYAVIVAEDLADYCCDVVWDGSSRTLNITKSDSKTEFTAPLTYKTSMPTGTVYADVLHTDIQTFVNGNPVTSFNVNGRTMIVIDEFGSYMDGYDWVPELRAAKAWLGGKHIKEYAPLTPRTEELFRNSYSNDIYAWTESYSGSYDFDFDGIDEGIEIEVSYDGYTTYLTIGNRTKRINTDCPGIEAIYACDIDTSDSYKDFVLITNEVSDDPIVRIFRYDELLTQYNFSVYDRWSDEWYLYDHYYTGYVNDHYFNANDDGTFTMRCQTPSAGMWDVYQDFYRDEYGSFVEKAPEYYYEVIPNSLSSRLEWDDTLWGYERTMMEKGYFLANASYSSNGITINRGEYFKILYDDGNDNIYIVKDNGTAGWIYMGYDVPVRYELNPVFYLAG